ncbi:unnamed protein product, partial [marine sediment metagenome]
MKVASSFIVSNFWIFSIPLQYSCLKCEVKFRVGDHVVKRKSKRPR